MFVVTGATEEEMAAAADKTRQQLAFYGSTPAYRGVLELHDRADLHPELNRLSKQGDWATMGSLIDDELLHDFAVVAEPDRLAGALTARWGGLLDRISFYTPYDTDADLWRGVLAQLKATADA